MTAPCTGICWSLHILKKSTPLYPTSAILPFRKTVTSWAAISPRALRRSISTAQKARRPATSPPTSERTWTAAPWMASTRKQANRASTTNQERRWQKAWNAPSAGRAFTGSASSSSLASPPVRCGVNCAALPARWHATRKVRNG